METLLLGVNDLLVSWRGTRSQASVCRFERIRTQVNGLVTILGCPLAFAMKSVGLSAGLSDAGHRFLAGVDPGMFGERVLSGTR
jgi:hypothetical protein